MLCWLWSKHVRTAALHQFACFLGSCPKNGRCSLADSWNKRQTLYKIQHIPYQKYKNNSKEQVLIQDSVKSSLKSVICHRGALQSGTPPCRPLFVLAVALTQHNNMNMVHVVSILLTCVLQNQSVLTGGSFSASLTNSLSCGISAPEWLCPHTGISAEECDSTCRSVCSWA